MKELTSAEIFTLVWDKVRNSPLYEAVPTMYADHYPLNPSGEFLVLTSLSNAIGEIQVSTVNLNIYVPDSTPTIDRKEQRYPNRRRLEELSRIAFDFLNTYPIDKRWHFRISGDTLISEEGISYSFINIKITFKKY